jgi:hypothetical protein
MRRLAGRCAGAAGVMYVVQVMAGAAGVLARRDSGAGCWLRPARITAQPWKVPQLNPSREAGAVIAVPGETRALRERAGVIVTAVARWPTAVLRSLFRPLVLAPWACSA